MIYHSLTFHRISFHLLQSLSVKIISESRVRLTTTFVVLSASELSLVILHSVYIKVIVRLLILSVKYVALNLDLVTKNSVTRSSIAWKVHFLSMAGFPHCLILALTHDLPPRLPLQKSF